MTQGEIFEGLCRKSGFDKNLLDDAARLCDCREVRTLCDAFFSDGAAQIVGGRTLFFPDAFYPSSFFRLARELFSDRKLSDEAGFLSLYLGFLPHTSELYRSLDLPDSVFFDTMKALSRSAYDCYSACGIFGLSDYIWLSNHVRGNVLRLGSFEYQNGIFSYGKTVTVGNKTIKDGDRVIFMHVPSGTEFDEASRLQSYKKASEIFGHSFLICDSWLLFPPHRDMLNRGNILSFSKDFTVFHTDYSTDYEDLYRVFGRQRDFSDVKSLPKGTTLQKKYIERIKKGLPSGSAVGARLI